MSRADRIPSQTTVLIVGGGPVGLTASALLSQNGIANIVVERRRESQRAPAAHVLRARPMEVFDRLGVGEEIRRAKPDLPMDYITWCSSLGGREIGRLDLRKGLPPGRDVWTNCPQNILEPILHEHARRQSSAEVATGAECIAIEQNQDRVRATIRLADGQEQFIDAAWMIAADGAGSRAREMVDIPMIGPGPQGRFLMVHFEADLRPLIEDRWGPIFWILNPQAAGTIIVHDPAKSHVLMALQSGAEGEEGAIQDRLTAALGADVDTRILSVDSWSPHVQVAERYREGRVFLAGDAAHRFPPTGGLGLNTGVLDADFLVHQLVRVECGEASSQVLDFYESECRPAAEANAAESFGNMKRLGEISKVLGPYADLSALEERLDAMTTDERDLLAKAIELQRSHFLSEGRLPRDPRSMSRDLRVGSNERLSP